MHNRRHSNPAPLFALAGMALLCPAAFAQQAGQVPPAALPLQAGPGVSAGGVTSQGSTTPGAGMTLKLMDAIITVHPSARLDVQHNDNIYSTPDNATGDHILVLTPALQLETRIGTNVYKLRLSSAIGEYQNRRSENYANTNLNGAAELNLGTHLRARIDADYADGVDPRGSTNNALASTPDHYRQTQGRGIFSYGAPSARGRIDLELGQLRRDYLNNRDTTAGSDRVVGDAGATFFWRTGPKSSLLFQGKRSVIDYALPASTLGSVEMAYVAGVQWDLSAKTAGTFRIGVTKKDFDDPARNSATTVSWTGAVRWSPRTYSTVDLSLNRQPAETTGGVGDYIDRSSTAVQWRHAWSSKVTTEAGASYLTDAYQGVARTDHTQNYSVRASYRMRRWLSFGGDYAHTLRSSDDSNYNYRRNVVMVFVNAAL